MHTLGVTPVGGATLLADWRPRGSPMGGHPWAGVIQTLVDIMSLCGHAGGGCAAGGVEAHERQLIGCNAKAGAQLGDVKRKEKR